MVSGLRASALLSWLIACVLAVFVLPASAFDEPAADQLQTIPPLTGPVVDLTSTLSAQQTEQLSQKLRSLHQRYGAQMQVLMVPTTQPEDVFSYSLRVVEKWQLGSKDKDDGLLLLIAKNDRKSHLQTGYGLEGVIPDIVGKSLLIDVLQPALRANDYAGGINAVIDASFQRISGEVTAMPEPQRRARSQQPGWLGPVIFGAIVIAILSNVIGSFLASGFGAVGVFLFVWLILGTSLLLAILLALASPLLALAFRHGGGYYGGGGFGGGGFGGGGFGAGGGGWSGGGGGFGGGGASGDW